MKRVRKSKENKNVNRMILTYSANNTCILYSSLSDSSNSTLSEGRNPGTAVNPSLTHWIVRIGIK